MNFEQLCDAIRLRLGVAPSDNFFTLPVLMDLVNEALQSVSVEYDWPWLTTTTTFDTVVGTQFYTPPATDVPGIWMKTKALTPTQNPALPPGEGWDSLQLRSLQEVREYGTVQGWPEIYTIHTERIMLAPVPSTVLTITHDYQRQEPVLVNPTDAPIMPTQFRWVILHLALHMAHMRQGEPQKAAIALADYTGWLTRMRSERRRVESTQRIRVRPGSWLN